MASRVRSDVWQAVHKALAKSAPEKVLAGLERSTDRDAQFLVGAVVDPTDRRQLDQAMRALAQLVAIPRKRAGLMAAVREPRHLASAQAMLAKKGDEDGLRPYIGAVICDGSSSSLKALQPIVRQRLAGENYQLEDFGDDLDKGRTPAMRTLATLMRAARVARLVKSPGGKLNALIGMGGTPTRFSLWMDSVDESARLELLINAPNGEWLDLNLSLGARVFSQFGDKIGGRLRRPRLTRLQDLPAWLASVGEWSWDTARWNTPLRGRAFAKLRAWLAGTAVSPGRSNAG